MPVSVEIGPVFREKIFFYFISVFSLFDYYLPLENGVTLHMNFTHVPCFVPGLFEIG